MTPAQKTAKGHGLIAEGHMLMAEAALDAASAPVPVVGSYSLAKSGPLPPGKSRDWTRRNLKSIPGAYRVGQAWCVSVADFLAWARALDLARVKAEVTRPTRNVQELAQAALAAAGYGRARVPSAEQVADAALARLGMRRASPVEAQQTPRAKRRPR